MTVAREEEKLKLGKGAAFVKSHFKRLRQEDETWEADFRALPKPITQSDTHYHGLVVTQPDGFLLGDTHVQGRPSVNDLATLLANAMRRPLTGSAIAPGAFMSGDTTSGESYSPTWRNSASKLPCRRNCPRSKKPTRLTCGSCERRTVSAWSNRPRSRPTSRRCSRPSHAGSGDTATSRSATRRCSASWCGLDYGGMVFEDDKPDMLAEAMAALEKGLNEYFEQEGIEIE